MMDPDRDALHAVIRDDNNGGLGVTVTRDIAVDSDFGSGKDVKHGVGLLNE
jgi:hypothetical protein